MGTTSEAVATVVVVIAESELEQHGGMWVAFDEPTGKVRAAADTADALYDVVDREQLGKVTIMRVPNLDDPIFISLDWP